MTKRELRRAVTEFRDGILDGRPSDRMCFAVCAPLQGFLSMCGLDTELVEVEFMTEAADAAAVPMNHVWLRMDDGTIIDPTADQFSSSAYTFPKVYIGPVPSLYLELQAPAESVI